MKYKLTNKFEKIFDKLDKGLKIKVSKQIKKIIDNPDIGKPMKFDRKTTRELYVKPFRISYEYRKGELLILFLDLYHKDKQ